MLLVKVGEGACILFMYLLLIEDYKEMLWQWLIQSLGSYDSVIAAFPVWMCLIAPDKALFTTEK